MAARDNEIDLIELLARAISSFTLNARWILLGLVAGILMGFIYFQITPRLFEGKMVITSEILNPEDAEQIAESFNTLLAQSNTKTIAERLLIPESDAVKVGSINILWKEPRSGRGDRDRGVFLVTAHVYDQNILPALQHGLLEYIGNIEFVKLRVAQGKRMAGELVKKIDEQLADLEVLKDKLAQTGVVRKEEGNLLVFDPSAVHNKIVELTKERFTQQNNLENVSGFQIVVGFTVFDKPIRPKLIKSVGGGATAGFIMAIVFILLNMARKRIHPSQNKIGHT